jgi:ABC-type bacteriocin/lantibiotic exporter with double-glycine peptidase domain
VRGAARVVTRASRESQRGTKPQRLRAILPDVWELVRPRRRLLSFSLVLMAIGRVAGLVLPGSTKFLIDDVIGRRRVELLLPLVGAVVIGTAIQA